MSRRRDSSDSGQPAKRAKVEQEAVDVTSTTMTTTAATSPPRRNARRSAATQSAAATALQAAEDAVASEAVPSRETIHDKVFAPVTDGELESWQGWTDIESEPAFFNVILRQMGVQNATVQEIFSVDEASMDHLVNPVGLIFLFRFVDEDEDDNNNEPTEDGEHAAADLWFANQITPNACASLAMLNIAMNCPQLRLADRLARFQTATRPLAPALRGRLLSTDAGLRAAHNTFARRLDMLTADLTLQEEAKEFAKKKAAAERRKKTTKARSTQNKKTKKPKSPLDDAAFHFIAYVPRGQDVWELDGLQEKPRRVGSIRNDQDWTAVARDRIAMRMLAYQQYDDMAVFNLLAMCQTTEGTDDDDDNDNNNEDHQDSRGEDVLRAAARKRDYTPVIHTWIKRLADKGVLQQLATET